MEGSISADTLALRTKLIKTVREDYDITHLIESHEALPSKYKTLLDNLNGFIAVCNLTTGLYEYLSEGIRSHLGYDVRGFSSEQLTHFVFSILYKPHREFMIDPFLPIVLQYLKENATKSTVTDYRFTVCAKVRN